MSVPKLVIGDKNSWQEYAIKLQNKTLGTDAPNHPDLFILESKTSISIAQVRELKKNLLLKPYQAPKKLAFLFDAGKMTLEAQNAILKILEEPPASAVIVLFATSSSSLLPTVTSRCATTNLGNSTTNDLPEELTEEKENLMKIFTSRAGERVRMANSLSRDPAEAKELVKKQIILLRKVLIAKPNIVIVEDIKNAQKTLNALQANVNPISCLANLFLSYHSE